MRDAEITRAAQTDEGYLVAKVTREQIGNNRAPYFSVGADLYASRRAFELGSEEAIIAGGCMHDEVLAAFPDLAPIVAMHLAWTDNGEPMHAVANAWYWYGSYDGKGTHLNQYRDTGRTDYDVACSHLRVESIAGPHDRASLERWIDAELRPQWQAEADAANEWIDANLGGVDVPADSDDDAEDFYLDLGEPDDEDSLRVHARLDGEGYREGVGYHYTYAVSVCDGSYTYETTYGGSVGDFNDGRICAREAAFGVLRELADFAQYDSPKEAAAEFGMEPEEIDNWPEWERTHEAAVALADAIEPHAAIVGR